jgi:phosphoserine aminotransferase
MTDQNKRPFNFSAGPSCLPVECLRTAQEDLMDWEGTGLSVLEQSHRSPAWGSLMNDTRSRLRSLLDIPTSHTILFIAGGASLQFSAIPFNFLGEATKVDYVVTGHWSHLAYEECQRLGFPGVDVHLVVPAPKGASTAIPSRDMWELSEDAAYCYICSNETIEGVQFREFPNVSAPLIIDMSSDFLSRPITNWDKIGCIFACAQKNFGIAGISVVIVRKDLLERPVKPFCPLTLDFRVQEKHGSMYNTPPTFPIYFASTVFKWIEDIGGVAEIQGINREKAAKLYDAIDQSPHFVNFVEKAVRSDMNIPFFRANAGETRDDALDARFLHFCSKRNLRTLKGFNTVGGYRASIYNAMPMAGVEALIEAIREFPGFAS